MTAIVVCPVSRLAETVAATGARHVVTLMNQGSTVPVSRESHGVEHRFIAFNDILEPAEGMICPDESHVGEFLEHVGAWDRRDPLVIHCYAGISRSTAGAYSAFCALRPDLGEEEIAARLRDRSPEATPNSRIVALADALLGRQGRMVRAIAAIGRGAEASEGSVFALRLDE